MGCTLYRYDNKFKHSKNDTNLKANISACNEATDKCNTSMEREYHQVSGLTKDQGHATFAMCKHIVLSVSKSGTDQQRIRIIRHSSLVPTIHDDLQKMKHLEKKMLFVTID